MIKKTIALFAVLAFASFSSYALAGGKCGGGKGCDGGKSEASSFTVLEASCGCGGNKGGDKS